MTDKRGSGTRTLMLEDGAARFVFEDVPTPPVPSLLRGFSAPVKVALDLTNAELLALLRHDTDPFNRWQAAQTVAIRLNHQRIAPLHLLKALLNSKDHRVREADEHQRMDLRARLDVAHPKVLTAVALMERSVENPLSCAALRPLWLIWLPP